MRIPVELNDAVARWWERANALSVLVEAFAALPPGQREELPRVIAASEFVAAALIQDPACLIWLARNDEPPAAHAANLDYERRVSGAASVAEAQHLLREWRRREMCRAAWRDITGRAAVTDTLAVVSELADACIRAARIAAQKFLEVPFGRPRNEAGEEVPLIVVAMGKLGGKELNFSSDIDLVFLYAEGGTTDGARPTDNSEYFNRVGRELIRLLDARTEDGFVFRVDMRLRPFGDSGALGGEPGGTRGLPAGTWPRLGALCVDQGARHGRRRAYAAATQDFMRPFVYRRYLDFGVFESLRDMKALIAREVARRELDQHLKLGPGGIREIGIHRAIHAAGARRQRSSGCRMRRCWRCCRLLAGSKLLSKTAVTELHESYLVLRKAENAVQMIRDEQTHSLPTDARRSCAPELNMGEPDWPSALARIEQARRTSGGQFRGAGVRRPGRAQRHDERRAGWLASDEVNIEEELRQFHFPPRRSRR
jgi:glutamate-ammonia-ligase adenylyltransferase